MRHISSIWDRLFIVFLGGIFGLHALWTALNRAPLAWDSASHTWISLQILSSLRHFDLHGVLIASNYYPIFIHSLTAGILAIVGIHIAASQYIAIIYFCLTLLAIYLYTGMIYKDRKIALLSSLLFAFFPLIADQAHWLMLDIPLVGLLFLSLYLFEKSELLTIRKPSIWFFVSVGLLLMTKWTGVLFLIFPLGIPLIRTIRGKQFKNLKQQSVHLLIGVGIVAAMCLPWYLTNYHSLMNQASISLQGDGGDPSALLSLANITDYLSLFINFQVTPFIAFISLVSSMYLIRRKGAHAGYLLGCIGAGYLLFTCIANKDSRYTLPLLPYTSMLIASALVRLSTYKKHLALGVGVIVYGVAILYTCFLLFRPSSLTKQVTIPVPLIGGVNIIDSENELVRTYDPHAWPVADLMETLSKDSQLTKAEMVVGFEAEHLNPSTLQTYLKAAELQHKLTNLTIKTPDIYHMNNSYHQDSFPDRKSMDDYLSGTKYALFSPTSLGTSYLRNKTALEQLRFHALSDSLTACTKFTTAVAPAKTTCFVDVEDVLSTGADVIVNDGPVLHKATAIRGYAKVSCPWGCSFGIVHAVPEEKQFRVTLLKRYKLPDGNNVNLYKLNSLTK